jgi:protein-tyrosine kinase
MSKVFEALRRLEKDTNGLSAEFAADAQAIFKEGPAAAQAVPPVEHASPALQNGNGGAHHHVVLEELPHETETYTDLEPSGFRTLPVRLSEDSPLMPFIPLEPSHQRAGEQYRIIRTKIVQHPRSPRVMVVSSVDSGDGKTVSAVNIAAALALKSDVNVLLIDGDLRRGKISDLLGLPNSPGLTDVMVGTQSPHEAIIQVEQFPNLHVLTAGTGLTNPTELLDSLRWRILVQELRKQFDYVVLDTPPIGSVADCDLIQAVSDGILLVARQDYTNRSRCMKAISSIPPERLLGVVLNCVEDWFLAKTASYYGYYPDPKGPNSKPKSVK